MSTVDRKTNPTPFQTRRKIMVVDDDTVVCTALSALLQARGYSVTCRSQAIGTSLAILRDKPDVVVLDVDMPGLTGDAISKILLNNKPAPAVIFYSSRSDEELERIVSETRALGAIRKGDPREFLMSFEALLARQL